MLGLSTEKIRLRRLLQAFQHCTDWQKQRLFSHDKQAYIHQHSTDCGQQTRTLIQSWWCSLDIYQHCTDWLRNTCLVMIHRPIQTLVKATKTESWKTSFEKNTLFFLCWWVRWRWVWSTVCPDEGLTLETSAIHQTSQAKTYHINLLLNKIAYFIISIAFKNFGWGGREDYFGREIWENWVIRVIRD